MKIKSEAGASIVEATIVLPLVILVILFLIALGVHFSKMSFKQINANSFSNMLLGENSGKRIAEYYGRSYDYTFSSAGVNRTIEARVREKNTFPYFLKNLISEDVIRRYKIDEKKLILYKDIINEKI